VGQVGSGGLVCESEVAAVSLGLEVVEVVLEGGGEGEHSGAGVVG